MRGRNGAGQPVVTVYLEGVGGGVLQVDRPCPHRERGRGGAVDQSVGMPGDHPKTWGL